MDQEHRLMELRTEQGEYKALLETPGWRRLEELVQGQVMLRRMGVFSKELRGLEDCFALAKDQGEITGLRLAMSLPDARLADLKRGLQTLLAEMEEAQHQTEGEEDHG